MAAPRPPCAPELEATRLGLSGDPAAALDSLLRASHWEKKEEWLGMPVGGYFSDLL